MNMKTTRAIDMLLDEAEKNARCAFSHDRNTQKNLRRRLSTGALTSPRTGLYARASYWEGLETRERALHIMRSLGQLHPNWVFSHYSAALAYNLYVSKALCRTVHIISPFQQSSPGIVHHRAHGESHTTVGGLNVTPLEQTIFDCARTADFPAALAISDSGLAAMGMNRAELCAHVRTRYRNYKGVNRALSVIAHADPRSESGGESIARAQMMELGFQLPDLQHEIADPLHPADTYRVDFYWELENGTRIAGEFDGMIKYTDKRYMNKRTTEQVLIDERERESRLNAAGILVMRFKYKHVLDKDYFGNLLTRFGIPRTNEPFLLT